MNSFTDDYLAKWSTLHGNAQPSRIVRAWLRIAAALARPFVRLGVSADLISLMGLLTAALAWWLAPNPWAAVVIIVSLILDGLDGAVAVITDRTTARGGVLDSTADRLAEAFWAAALVAVGADLQVVIAAWVLALIQEYARARSLSLVPHASITASICERPVRALIIASGVGTATMASTVNVWATAWLVLQAVAFVQVWMANRSLLR